MKTKDKDLELVQQFFYSDYKGWDKLYLERDMCDSLFDILNKAFGKHLNCVHFNTELGTIVFVLLPNMWLCVTKSDSKFIVNRYFVVDSEWVLDNQLATSTYEGLVKLLTREINLALDTSGLAKSSKDSAKPKSNNDKAADAEDIDDDVEISANTRINYCESSIEMLEELIEAKDTDAYWHKRLDKFCSKNPKKKHTAEHRIRKILKHYDLSTHDNWLEIAHLALMQAEMITSKG